MTKKKTLLILFFLFFTSLILFKNDINSKIIIITFLLSMFNIHKNDLKVAVLNNHPLLLLFLLAFSSILYSNDLFMGLNKLKDLLIIPVVVFMFSTIRKEDVNIDKILILFILTVLFATLFSHSIVLSNFMSNNEPSYKNFFNLNYSYKALGNTIHLHTTYYSLYILTAITFLFHFLKKHSTKPYVKVLITLCVLYFSFFLVQLSSRISIALLYIITILNIVDYTIKNCKIITGISALLIFHLVAILIIMNVGVTKYRFQHLLGFTYYNGYTVNDSEHKLKLWSAAVHSNDNFLFGNGLGDIQSSLNAQYEIEGLKAPLKGEYNSHNQYIEYYVGLGVIGLCFFLYVLLYYARFFIVRKNLLGIQFMLLIATISLTECLWNRHNGIVFILFMLMFLIKGSDSVYILDSNS